jgi:hypothetical protein
MIGYDTSYGFEMGPLDNRDSEDPEFEVNTKLSCSNTNFGGKDPADEPEPNKEVEPAWNHDEKGEF